MILQALEYEIGKFKLGANLFRYSLITLNFCFQNVRSVLIYCSSVPFVSFSFGSNLLAEHGKVLDEFFLSTAGIEL